MSEVSTSRPRLLAPPPTSALVARGRPTISVVIGYYRRPDVIAEAVASALEQTLPPHEIVVCDDGSPDDLDSALGPLRDRVTVVRRRNGGPAAALNTAIGAAHGEFVVQLDSDDVFLPGRIEAISDAIVRRPDVDIVATDAWIEPPGRAAIRYTASNPFEVESQRVEILRRNFFAWPALRRSHFMDVGGFDESLYHASDWEGFIRLILDGALVALVDAPLYRWRLSSGSVSSSLAESAAEEAAFLQKVFESQGLTEEERAALEDSIFHTRQRALLLGAKQAISDRRPDARRRSLAVLTGHGFSLVRRLKAGLAVLSPSLAHRLLADRYGEGTLERRFGPDWAGNTVGGVDVPTDMDRP